MLHILDLINDGPQAQIFTHYDEVEGQLDIAVSRIETICRDLPAPLHTIPLDAQYAALIEKQRGLEAPRLKRLTVEMCDAHPLLFLEFDRTKTHLLADGNHRYYCLHRFGRKLARAWIVPETVWRAYLISGLPQVPPDEMLNSHSGWKE